MCCMCVNAAPRMRPLATKVGLELNKYLLLPEASQLWGLSPGLKHYGGPEQFTIVNVQVTPTRLWWWARCWLTAVTPTWSAGSTRTARGSRSTRSCTERYRYGGRNQNWVCNKCLTFRKRQRDNIWMLLWHAKMRKMFATWRQNVCHV